MSRETEAVMDQLIDRYPQLAHLREEHLMENEGEMLPHLLLADIVRWTIANRSTDRHAANGVYRWMNDTFINGPDDVRGLIAVSGVEMIPNPGSPGSEFRALLAPELEEVDPWRPR